MSFVLFKDSFSRYKVATSGDSSLVTNIQERYTFARGTWAIDTSGGIGPELQLVGGSVGKTLAHSSRWVGGHRYRYISTSLGNSDIYQLLNNDKIMASVAQNADGTLSLKTNNGGTVLGVSTRSLFSGIRYYVEWDFTLSGSSPVSVLGELRINGHVETSGSGSTGYNANQLLSGAADANLHAFNGTAGGAGTGSWIKDIYLKNEAGYDGDTHIVALYPASDGGILQWTPNSGLVHFNRVNSHPVDITKWLQTATPGNIDLWGFDSLPVFSGTIEGINISVLAQKDDEGTKSFKIVTGATGTDFQSDEFFVSATNPEYYEAYLKTDPQTGLAWTQAGVNALKAGVLCVS